VNPRPNKLKLLRWLPSTWMLTTGPAADGSLYLTFDDGPQHQHTPRLLDLLAQNEARATFFLLGEQVEKFPQIVQRMVDEGHQLGNHSYDHPRFTRIPHSLQLGQIERTEKLLSAIDGKREHRFRPPSGRFPLSLLLHFAIHRSSIAYWSYDSLDYQHKPAGTLVELMRRHPPLAGDILLFHDDSDATIDALAILLPEWRRAGFDLRTLPELAAA
jgi:peptidoglycan-N-acetylglucosamine deacetylase